MQTRLLRKLVLDPLQTFNGTNCLIWTGTKVSGYGQIGITKGVKQYTHRVAYEMFVGPIPSGMTIDHLCRTRACANTAHMEVVSAAENSRRGVAANMPNDGNTCKRGHPRNEENTYIYSRNGRAYFMCRPCRRLHQGKHYERRNERRRTGRPPGRPRRSSL